MQLVVVTLIPSFLPASYRMSLYCALSRHFFYLFFLLKTNKRVRADDVDKNLLMATNLSASKS